MIVLCPRCGEPRYVRRGRREFVCFRCNAMRPLSQARILGEARDVMSAVHAVQRLKMRGREA